VGKDCLAVTGLTLSFSFQHLVYENEIVETQIRKKACHKVTIINIVGCVMYSIILLSLPRARRLSGTNRDRCSARCSDKRNGLSFCVLTVIVTGTANWEHTCNSINKHISRCNGYTTSCVSDRGRK